MTQWQSPAIQLHSHYGVFEVITAYTPTHSYSHTLTYRCQVDPSYWSGFFDQQDHRNEEGWVASGSFVDPKSEESLIALQDKIEAGSGPYFLSGAEIRSQGLGERLEVYQMK